MLRVIFDHVSELLNVVSSYKKTCLSVLTSSIIIFIYRSYGGEKARSKPVRNLTEVIFFTDDFSYRTTSKRSQSGVENLRKLTDHLNSAKVSLDVCVFTITSHVLGEVVLKKFREGVKVRIITDDSMAFGDSSQIPKFRREGIMVRVRQSQSLMHHKFAIVDNELLINGSFNWTEQATFGNWENVSITTVPVKLVESYVNHFESLWTKLNANS